MDREFDPGRGRQSDLFDLSRPSGTVCRTAAQEFPGPAFACQVVGVAVGRWVPPIWSWVVLRLFAHGDAFSKWSARSWGNRLERTSGMLPEKATQGPVGRNGLIIE